MTTFGAPGGGTWIRGRAGVDSVSSSLMTPVNGVSGPGMEVLIRVGTS